ncbi:hypothetical protein [Bradyrhizobium neotropicale]|uniref:hypothetical protein n=1 Tax=Bradyrhizobium neotropicale TaxID=1497615 RepID=UPI003908084C
MTAIPRTAWSVTRTSARNAGSTVLAFMMWGAPSGVGLILRAEAIIRVGDMLLILAEGPTKSAFGMHGLAAVIMVEVLELEAMHRRVQRGAFLGWSGFLTDRKSII